MINLVARLRSCVGTSLVPSMLTEAAEALEAQAERIAELDSLAANAIVAAADSQKAYMKLLDENFALRAQRAELEEAEKRVLAKAAELGIYNHHATKALVEALKGK